MPVAGTNVMRSCLGSDNRAWEAVLARVSLLSGRELEVFHLLAQGASNRTIAGRLGITERTAKAHLAQILAKLDVESRLQAGLVAFASEALSRDGAFPIRAVPARSAPHHPSELTPEGW